MCGINGILTLRGDGPPVDRDELLRTRDAMAARGPDGSGSWISADGRIGLGHRRLAIIDLTEAGAQPMSFESGRYRIVFNGEIYNYRELRSELAARGVGFRSHSDTEVILALYAREREAMLPRLRGMYAFAIWDEQERTLFLARDPYGIKPLYYTTTGDVLRFASQVRALEAAGTVPAEVDPAGLTGFLLWGSVPEPWTIRRAVRAVPSGHWLRVAHGVVSQPVAHYDFAAEPDADDRGPDDVSAALEESARAHLVADVPIAVFLSAGLDSSLIAALAGRQGDEPLTTLTLRFDEYGGTRLDEAPLAAAVARDLGTRHIERRVERDESAGLWTAALAAMDQPSIDGFNTYVVSKVAHEEGFKVVLSGLGGDELFGSYDSFADVPRWSRIGRLVGRLPGAGQLWPALARRLRPDKPKLAGLASAGRTLPGAYFLRRGLFLPGELPRLLGDDVAREGLAAYDPVLDAGKHVPPPVAADPWRAVHVMESTQYMRNQLLRDSDWASMAHSLELRVPLVDTRLRDVMASARFEPARGEGKAEVVRRAAPGLPSALWTRPKSGFSIPVMEWLESEIGVETSRGLVSRRLALRVLAAFGVSL